MLVSPLARSLAIDLGHDAVEPAGGKRHGVRGISERLQPGLPGGDGTAERGIRGETRLGRQPLVRGQRAQHVFARQGVQVVALSLRHRGIPSTLSGCA